MAEHAPPTVKGKLLFWSMQILCKQNTLLATAQNNYICLFIAILERNLRSFRIKYNHHPPLPAR